MRLPLLTAALVLVAIAQGQPSDELLIQRAQEVCRQVVDSDIPLGEAEVQRVMETVSVRLGERIRVGFAQSSSTIVSLAVIGAGASDADRKGGLKYVTEGSRIEHARELIAKIRPMSDDFSEVQVRPAPAGSADEGLVVVEFRKPASKISTGEFYAAAFNAYTGGLVTFICTARGSGFVRPANALSEAEAIRLAGDALELYIRRLPKERQAAARMYAVGEPQALMTYSQINGGYDGPVRGEDSSPERKARWQVIIGSFELSLDAESGKVMGMLEAVSGPPSAEPGKPAPKPFERKDAREPGSPVPAILAALAAAGGIVFLLWRRARPA